MQTFLTIVCGFIGSILVIILYSDIVSFIRSCTSKNIAKAKMFLAIADTFEDAFDDVHRRDNLKIVKGEKTNGDRKRDPES